MDALSPAPSAPSAHKNFAFWNVNGLIPRISTSSNLIKEFLQLHSPSILFLSEVRMVSELTNQAVPSMKDKKCQEDKRAYDSAFSRTGPFSDYTVHGLSLHPSKRYAGTLLAIKNGTEPPINVTYTIPGSSAASSTTALHHPPPTKTQTKSIASFFAPKTPNPNPNPKKRSSPSSSSQPHNPDGRVILSEFSSYYILHVYAPNNGSTPTSWSRRLTWDASIQSFFSTHKSGYPSSLNSTILKPIFYCGDLNVTPSPRLDTSHPSWMSKQFLKSGSPENSGQPGELGILLLVK